MHFLCCSDAVLRQLNRKAWNKVISTIRSLRITRTISAAFYNILDGLMLGSTPIRPEFPDDKIGAIVQQAWDDQEAVGWVNVAKGRLCKRWGVAQELFYQMHPDLRHKRWCTSAQWMKRMVGALLDMSLQMWKNRCDCLHGQSKQEQIKKRKAKLQKRVEWWYRHRHIVPEAGQYLFRTQWEQLCRARSPYYLEKWLETVECRRTQAMNELPGNYGMNTAEKDSQSDATMDTAALDEYLIDVNNGMDMDGAMAEAGYCTGEGAMSGNYEETAGCLNPPLEVEYDDNEYRELEGCVLQQTIDETAKAYDPSKLRASSNSGDDTIYMEEKPPWKRQN